MELGPSSFKFNAQAIGLLLTWQPKVFMEDIFGISFNSKQKKKGMGNVVINLIYYLRGFSL